MSTAIEARLKVVNGVGAPWYDDLTPALLDECIETGVGVIGCTANETWNETVETIENLQYVKEVVRTHGRAYIVNAAADLEREENWQKVGVVLGFQNPKPLSDSPYQLEAFADMGLRCCSLAFRENSYYGGGYLADPDSGLTSLGRRAIEIMNRRGIVIDLSHSGDRTALDAVRLSQHPVIFSHSSSRTLTSARQTARTTELQSVGVRRAAPDELIAAAAEKGGVICQDARDRISVTEYVDRIEYMAKLIGIDHVGVSAQDDWHRSRKDTRRIAPYLPVFNHEYKTRDWTDDRVYRLEGELGPKLLYPDNLTREMQSRNFSQSDIDKVLGGNLVRVFKQVLP
jgi:membrane dipeptidase